MNEGSDVLTSVSKYLGSLRSGLQAKFERVEQHLILSLAHILMVPLLVFIHQAIFAAQTPNELQNTSAKKIVSKNEIAPNDLAALQNSARVEVYFLRPYFESFRALEEPDLRKFGCKYESHKKEEIKDLANIVSESNLEENRKFPLRAGAIQGVYFYSNQGVIAKMILSQFFTEDKYATGVFNEKQIIANHSLSFRLYSWASKLPPDSNCTDFIDYYKNKK